MIARILALIAVLFVCTACDPPAPTSKTDEIGTGKIAGKHNDRVGLNHQQCRFSVELPGTNLSYTAQKLGGGNAFEKCLNLTNGIPIRIFKTVRLIEPDKGKASYMGKIDATEFPLN